MEEQKPKKKGKILIYKGLPASGKSTAAKEALADGNVMRVNRDDIRNMLFKRWKGRKEQVVTAIEKAAVRAAVSNGFDIIIDDTNLNPSTIASWKTLANELGVLVDEIRFETSLEECIQRDALREGRAHVGRAVIENMALRYNLIPKVPSDKKIVIFDMDGTLADCMHRKIYLNVCKNCNETEEFHKEPSVNDCPGFISGKKNHKMFYSLVPQDTLIMPVWNWIRNCYYQNPPYEVLIVSGRPTDLAGDATVEWLRFYGVPYDHIFMRAAGDFRDDAIIKQEILDKILEWVPKEQILFTVDDRPKIVRMWQQNDITCYNVGEGIEF